MQSFKIENNKKKLQLEVTERPHKWLGNITTRFKWIGTHPPGISEGTKESSEMSFTIPYLQKKPVSNQTTCNKNKLH